jgi:nicotinate-nucleotide pyrophosphorylase (carboxylating)
VTLPRPRTPTSPTAAPRRGLEGAPSPAAWDAVVLRALAEDLGIDEGGGWTPAEAVARDLSSAATIGPERRARGLLLAKQSGVLAGLDGFARTFRLLDPNARVTSPLSDGDRFDAGATVAEVVGLAGALLVAERTALNLVQRLSGTATATAALVAEARLGNPRARVLDTRKTTPGLRMLERHAVLCGGGENHRYGLDDEVMLKNNHLDLSGGDGRGLAGLVERARAAVGPQVRITAEARDRDEALAAIRAGADVLLLDNFTPAALEPLCIELREVARELGRAVELEASGGIDRSTARAFAAAGVDRLSIGALTHSAPALDLSLRLSPVESEGAR